MGSRKRQSSQNLKKEKQNLVFASLNYLPTSPRKMRFLVDLIRNTNIMQALNILKSSKNHASGPLRKLLLSAVYNWKNKISFEILNNLYIKEIKVDNAGILKRIRPAPQGRGHRIRKRSNHVSIILEII